jgi:hypothetical protein
MEGPSNCVSTVIQLSKPINLKDPEDGGSTFSEKLGRNRATWCKAPEYVYRNVWTVELTQMLQQKCCAGVDASTPGGKGGFASHEADHRAICELSVCTMFKPRSLTILRASTACYMDSFDFNPYLASTYGTECLCSKPKP